MSTVTLFEVVGDVVFVKPARRDYAYSFKGVLPVEGRGWTKLEGLADMYKHTGEVATVTIDAALVAWLLKAPGTADVRYYLNNLAIEPKTGCMAATDGHRMHVYEPNGASVSCIEGTDWVFISTSLAKMLPKKGTVEVSYSKRNSDWLVWFTAPDGITYMGFKEAAKFPDISRVIPDFTPSKALVTTKKELAAITKSLKAYKPATKDLTACVITKDGNRVADGVFGLTGQDKGLPVIDFGLRSDYSYPDFAPKGAPTFNAPYLVDALAMCEFGDVRYVERNDGGTWGCLKIQAHTAQGTCTAIVMGVRGYMSSVECIEGESEAAINRFKAQVAAHEAA